MTRRARRALCKEQPLPPVIGLTGLPLSGKSTVARFLEERGARVIDVDRVGHEVLEESRQAVIARFGEEVCGKAGAIDRRVTRLPRKPAEQL